MYINTRYDIHDVPTGCCVTMLREDCIAVGGSTVISVGPALKPLAENKRLACTIVDGSIKPYVYTMHIHLYMYMYIVYTQLHQGG